MTKEAKAAEMARRKEERKQVINIFAPEKCQLTVFALAHCHVQRTEESSHKDVKDRITVCKPQRLYSPTT
jgi:hypothetical protein